MDTIVIISGAILDAVLLLIGSIMWYLQNKNSYKNTKAQDTIWKLVDIVTLLLAGYILGGKTI